MNIAYLKIAISILILLISSFVILQYIYYGIALSRSIFFGSSFDYNSYLVFGFAVVVEAVSIFYLVRILRSKHRDR